MDKEERYLPTPFDGSNVSGWARDVLESRRFMSQQGMTVRNRIHGEPVLFHISDPEDLIQRHHMVGRFFEPDELLGIQQYMPFGGNYLDIGANIGNHALYVAKFMRPRTVIPIEPNPLAIERMITNFAINGLNKQINTSHLGVGIGTPGDNFGFNTPRGNLGATQMVQGSGDVQVVSGDSLFAKRKIHFIKIDVEGMEIEVLNSIKQTVANSQPNMLVEVDTTNRALFQNWVNDMKYSVAKRFHQHRANQNFMIVPASNTPGDFVPVTI